MATIPLREAGYREKAFVKSWLAERASGQRFAACLERATYDPSRDVVWFGFGHIKVRREGSESLAILRQHGYDDSDCQGDGAAPKPPLAYEEVQRRALACALADACEYLNNDRRLHMTAHGDWHLDTGDLQAALELGGIMISTGHTSEEDVVAWEKRIAERAKA